MLSALEMCHSTGIAHRDIKPENILLDDNFQLRMADFGLSSIMEVRETTIGHSLVLDLDLERFARCVLSSLSATLFSDAVLDTRYPNQPTDVFDIGRTKTECATPSAVLAATWPQRCWQSNHMTVLRRTSGLQAWFYSSCSQATPRSKWQSPRTGGSEPYQAGATTAFGLPTFEAVLTSRHLHRREFIR